MNAIFFIIPIIALALLLGFAVVWSKDRQRTHEQAKDVERHDT